MVSLSRWFIHCLLSTSLKHLSFYIWQSLAFPLRLLLDCQTGDWLVTPLFGRKCYYTKVHSILWKILWTKYKGISSYRSFSSTSMMWISHFTISQKCILNWDLVTLKAFWVQWTHCQCLPSQPQSSLILHFITCRQLTLGKIQKGWRGAQPIVKKWYTEMVSNHNVML